VFTKEIEHTDFPLDEIKTVFRQQRDPLAERVLSNAKPVLASRFGERRGRSYIYSSISSKIYNVKKIMSGSAFFWGVGTKICRSATPLHQRPASIKGWWPEVRGRRCEYQPEYIPGPRSGSKRSPRSPFERSRFVRNGIVGSQQANLLLAKHHIGEKSLVFLSC
jgi:hypothetical protein